MKKHLLFLLMFLMVFTTNVSAQSTNILIDGKAVVFTESTGSPFADENSRTQVPLRVTMESFGATVDWEQETQTAIVSKDGIIVKVPMGQMYILVNDVPREMDTKSVIVNQRIYLPIRFVVESFGATVGWEQETRSVIITSNAATEDFSSMQNHLKDLIKADHKAQIISQVPVYAGQPYVTINNNIPYFSESEIATSATSFEKYDELDHLGRCQSVVASIGKDLMPTTERESIGMIKPTGWETVRYDIVENQYLYNRCHLIGYQLTGENANEKNLITGTRYMNVEGMLPFENMVANYVKKTNNHVLYRVTPIFEGTNLLASGVVIEAISVEDKGKGLKFNVYCYNVQPGIEIDYATGKSRLKETESKEETNTYVPTSSTTYVLNTNTKKFHEESCSSVKSIKPQNKEYTSQTREQLLNNGYSPCGNCKP